MATKVSQHETLRMSTPNFQTFALASLRSTFATSTVLSIVSNYHNVACTFSCLNMPL